MGERGIPTFRAVFQQVSSNSGRRANPSERAPRWTRERRSRKRPPGRVRDETKSSAVSPATNFSLTHGEYRIGSGSACRAKPVRGAASGVSPQPDAAPLPCGSAPFETHRDSTSSRCRERYQPFVGCLRRIRSAVLFRARCCLRATSLGRAAHSPSCCANRKRCGCRGVSCCGRAAEKPL